MKHKYVIGIDGSGADELLRGIEEYQKWIETKTRELLNRLTLEGFEIAHAGFSSAVYDGTNDSFVTVEARGDNAKAVIALGNAVLFIEFGTGVVYPDTHPLSGQYGMIRGEYGKGYGKRRTWAYYGDAGTNGVVQKNGAVLTHGNPANMPMYNAVKMLQERLPKIVSEVFADA